ncbi:phosphopantetheinyl transferase [Thiohalobacter thiocyanaticus]|uniref:Phosphopantetheinyl transferase n=1 Tax=Thiohalobacter thiocyanaticus TaxID=585455 RepID=A0A1Z4VQX8_9GAMM|nr:hypothetical protein [Thiohalobacter thiocyanaticus]BAZ93738.1 phosphopantetheinyl transferase [Thiohalobacter thiocyanaticus]
MPVRETNYQDEELSVTKAEELIECGDDLRLVLGRLDCNAARALEAFKGNSIFIDGHLPLLDHCSAESLIALGGNGKLKLHWVAAGQHNGHLDKTTVLNLARFADSVSLDGIDALDVQDAHILQSFNGTQLLLYPRSMSPEVADLISRASPALILVSIPEISPETVQALAKSRAWDEFQLYLEDSALSPSIASALSSIYAEHLTLACTHVDAESAAQLAGFHGTLRLQCPTIAADAVKILTASSAGLELSLNGTTLERDLAEAIANGANPFVHLYGINSLGAGTADVLNSTDKEVYIETNLGEVLDFI